MGIEPFLLASTVRLVLAQRLVRRLCTRCRAPRETDARARQLMGDGFDGLLYRAVGCAHCNHTGYAGRPGVYEAITIDDEMRRLIGDNASEDALAEAAFARADRLAASARSAVAAGLTQLAEAQNGQASCRARVGQDV